MNLAIATVLLTEALPAIDEMDLDRMHLGVMNTQTLCHALAKKSGWWDGVDVSDKNIIGTKLCLVHSEISEALEGIRKDKMDDHLTDRRCVEVELADAIIRIFDLAGAMKLDIASALLEKLAYNQQRADHKRENRAADGGKKI